MSAPPFLPPIPVVSPLIPPPPSPNPSSQTPTAITITAVTPASLQHILDTSLDSSSDEVKLGWAHDVIRLLDKHIESTSSSHSSSTLDIPESISTLLIPAIPIIISSTTHPSPPLSSLSHYLKAHLQSTGSCPEEIPKDPRQAFKDFEVAARTGYTRGWFRLGRDYEVCGEIKRAKECYARGVKKGEAECLYVSNKKPG